MLHGLLPVNPEWNGFVNVDVDRGIDHNRVSIRPLIHPLANVLSMNRLQKSFYNRAFLPPILTDRPVDVEG